MKAYHYIAEGGAALDRILEAGTVLPAIYRIDPLDIGDQCDEMMGKLDHAARMDPKKAPAVSAVRELIQEKIGEIYVAQQQDPVTDGSPTKLRCEDLLAGDLTFVFLSVGDWVREIFGGEEFVPNGLVFDAEFLVRQGARVRMGDLFDEYYMAVTELVWHETYDDVRDARSALIEKLRRIQGRSRGVDMELEKLGRASTWAEIVYPGILPAEWSIEIWRDGRLEAEKAHGRDKK